MITFKTLQQIETNDTYHKVSVMKSIGTFQEGSVSDVQIMRMTGRIYKPGKDKEGKFIDAVGEKDTRLMIFDSKNYACVSETELQESFNEI